MKSGAPLLGLAKYIYYKEVHVVFVQWTSEKCTKKRDARAELFWSLNLLFFEVVVVVVVVVA